jgi:hypothetical protein
MRITKRLGDDDEAVIIVLRPANHVHPARARFRVARPASAGTINSKPMVRVCVVARAAAAAEPTAAAPTAAPESFSCLRGLTVTAMTRDAKAALVCAKFPAGATVSLSTTVTAALTVVFTVAARPGERTPVAPFPAAAALPAATARDDEALVQLAGRTAPTHVGGAAATVPYVAAYLTAR